MTTWFADCEPVAMEECRLVLHTNSDFKRDIITKRFEVKALVGLKEEEYEEVLHFLNCTDYQKSVLLKRGKTIPTWGETE